MQVFHRLEELSQKLTTPLTSAAVAIGNFDGVHLGHAALLRNMVEHSRLVGATPTTLTFYPHPVEVLRPSIKLERLTTASEKLALLEAMGVELVLVEKFDAHLAGLSAREFFDNYLVNGLKAKSVHVGFDFSFGKGREGNVDVLGQMARERGIHLQVEAPHQLGELKISSSAIRQLIRDGDVAKAAEWLGRPYSIVGPVVQGDRRGAKLGFPTANVRYPAEKVLPKNGVYLTRATWQKQNFRSVTNVGIRPTFNQEASPNVEVHLLDFSARLYDEYLQVEFLERIRDEKKFDSLDALKAQIAMDVARAKSQQPK
jgi:riboflavin kinase/FMN adenylyltransferase